MTMQKIIFFSVLLIIAIGIIILVAANFLVEEAQEADNPDPVDIHYIYEYKPTEGYEIVDGILPEDIANLDEFNKIACMIAQTIYGEARGLSKYDQSMVAWCILNRFDDGHFGTSIEDVITAPFQFVGYKESNPVDKDMYELAVDVLMRWEYESYTVGNSGRTLPKEFTYFHGNGKKNIYRAGYNATIAYDEYLPNPYEE